MAITAAALGSLLTTQADYNYYIQQQIFWTNKYDANSAKLEEQVKYETKWESAFDKAMDGEKECKVRGQVFVQKDAGTVSEAQARRYADAAASQYNEELSLELADLDIEYDTMKTMYDTLVQELQGQKDSQKTLVGTCAQDTGLLNQ